MAVSLDHRLFTADEFERMGEAGIFDEDERLELLAGEIVAMSPIGAPTSISRRSQSRRILTATCWNGPSPGSPPEADRFPAIRQA